MQRSKSRPCTQRTDPGRKMLVMLPPACMAPADAVRYLYTGSAGQPPTKEKKEKKKMQVLQSYLPIQGDPLVRRLVTASLSVNCSAIHLLCDFANSQLRNS